MQRVSFIGSNPQPVIANYCAFGLPPRGKMTQMRPHLLRDLDSESDCAEGFFAVISRTQALPWWAA
jgi:hypothetical protein